MTTKTLLKVKGMICKLLHFVINSRG